LQLPEWVARFEGEYRRQFNLRRFSVDDKRHEIRIYSQNSEPEVTLERIPEELLQMVISGYEVIACWLKFHSYAYTRTAFTIEDFRGLLRLLSCLDLQTDMIQEIDAVLDRVISGDIELL
jgi:hypothetical protein